MEVDISHEDQVCSFWRNHFPAQCVSFQIGCEVYTGSIQVLNVDEFGGVHMTLHGVTSRSLTRVVA